VVDVDEAREAVAAEELVLGLALRELVEAAGELAPARTGRDRDRQRPRLEAVVGVGDADGQVVERRGAGVAVARDDEPARPRRGRVRADGARTVEELARDPYLRPPAVRAAARRDEREEEGRQ
jgi:hypothetical protein